MATAEADQAGPERDEPVLAGWERRTDAPLTVLSVLFLLVYAVQVLATRPGGPGYAALDVGLWALWVVFVADYVVRVACARRRWRFVVRHPIDLLVVLAPFFRFLRLLRLVAAVSVLGRALRDDLRGRVAIYLVASVSLLGTVAALAVFEAERDAPNASITTFGEAIWWVITTMTTVGYGDRYPVTTEGRLVAAGLMVAGVAVLGTVTASIASWFLEQVGASADEAAAVGRAAERRRTDAESARLDQVLAELRALRTRLDELEAGAVDDGGLRPGPAAPRSAPAPSSRPPG